MNLLNNYRIYSNIIMKIIYFLVFSIKQFQYNMYFNPIIYFFYCYLLFLWNFQYIPFIKEYYIIYIYLSLFIIIQNFLVNE